MATLGVLILLQGIAVIRYGARVTFVEPELPTNLLTVFGKAVSVLFFGNDTRYEGCYVKS